VKGGKRGRDESTVGTENGTEPVDKDARLDGKGIVQDWIGGGMIVDDNEATEGGVVAQQRRIGATDTNNTARSSQRCERAKQALSSSG
jgi:hypothetical protein